MDIPKFTFKSLHDLSLAFSTEKSCIKHLELHRWKDGIPVSLYVPTSQYIIVELECAAVKIQVKISIQNRRFT
jgi:hypothetical protein